MEREEKRKAGALMAHGKQVMHRRRDDKTKVKSLVLPKNQKGRCAAALASMLTMSKWCAFW
jgi:hypothetical protein